jgi:hypothetical protein
VLGEKGTLKMKEENVFTDLIQAIRNELLSDPQLRALANGYSLQESERHLLVEQMFGEGGDFIGRPEGL